MTNDLQPLLVQILTSIHAAAGRAGDFAIAQLPDIAQSYIVYGRAWGLFSTIVMGAVAIWLMVLVVRCCQRKSVGDGEQILALLQFCGSMVFGAVALANVKFAFLVWFAPKVWLLERLAQLVKG